MIRVSKQERRRAGGCMSCERAITVVYVVAQSTRHGNMTQETRYCMMCAGDLAALIRQGGGAVGLEDLDG